MTVYGFILQCPESGVTLSTKMVADGIVGLYPDIFSAGIEPATSALRNYGIDTTFSYNEMYKHRALTN